MALSLAITEKKRLTSSGFIGTVFFRLFDWNRMLSPQKKKKNNRNKKKKLCFSSDLLPSPVSKRFGEDEKMPKSKLLLNNANENHGGFPNSTKHPNNGMRDPGVVARLMGLESMPIPKKASKDSEFNSNQSETSDCKVQPRPQKVQKTEVLTGSSFEHLKFSKRGRRQQHHKLASPAKSPRMLSRRSTARLVEAATKILEPGLQSRRDSHAKCPLTYTGSSKSNEEVLKDAFFMKNSGDSLNGSFVGTCQSFRSLNDGKEKKSSSHFRQVSINAERSDVVQAKINADSKDSSSFEKKKYVQNDCRVDGPSKCASKENKEFPVSKECDRRVRRKEPVTSTGRRNFAAFDTNVTRCTPSGSSTKLLGRERLKLESNEFERRNMDRKRRPNNSSQSENARMERFSLEKKRSEKGPVCSHSANQNFIKNDPKGYLNGNLASTRHDRRLFSDEEMLKKRRGADKRGSDASHQPKTESTTSPRGSTLEGDTLTALLEEKIRELNSLDQDELTKGNESAARSTASILEELISALRPSKHGNSCFGLTNLSDHTILHGDMGKSNAKNQTKAEAGVLAAFPAADSEQPSPVSILEASFSNGSCFSGSPSGSSGHKPDFESVDTSCNKIRSLDLDAELLDSASSFGTKKFDTQKTCEPMKKNSRMQDICFDGIRSSECKLTYSTEAKSNAELLLESTSLCKANEIDSFLCNTSVAIIEALGATQVKDTNELRRLLFDCVVESMDSKCNLLFKSEYRSGRRKLPWFRTRERLASEVCEEVRGWHSLAGKVMDDIVEYDAIHTNKMWTEFGSGAFEIARDTANDLLQEMLDEMLVDQCFC